MASKSTKSELDTNLLKLKELIKENTEHGEHANEISTILLWIATNHPELLKKKTKELQNVSVKHLHFPKSWETLDKLVPTESLITLLESKVCKDLESFCGYVNTQVLKHLPNEVSTFRLALGKLIDNGSLLEELRCRQARKAENIGPNASAPYCRSWRIIIHLKCSELEVEDLSQLPVCGHIYPEIYISDASDNNTNWVIQAISALRPKNTEDPEIEAVCLPRSKLTASGVEAIAKGLKEANIILSNFKISSSNINDDTKIPGYEYSDENSDEDTDEDSDEEEDTDKFCRMITKKYFSEDYTMMDFTDEKGMDFTDFQEFVPSDVTKSLVEQLSKYKINEDSDDDSEECKVLQAVLRKHFNASIYPDEQLLWEYGL